MEYGDGWYGVMGDGYLMMVSGRWSVVDKNGCLVKSADGSMRMRETGKK